MTNAISEPIELGVLSDEGRALLFDDARTANSFADTPVTDDELRSIWNLAKWAPSQTNTQPLRVLFVRSPEAKERLVPHMVEGNRAKTASAPVVAILAKDSEFFEYMPEVFPHRPTVREYFAGNESLATSVAHNNAWLQAGYFILAIRAHGLAAGPMAGFDNAGIDAEFFPDGRLHSIAVINIGHPGVEPWFGRLPRLADEDVLTFI
jgi:3-hydroxypropanoate dehydrogenase